VCVPTRHAGIKDVIIDGETGYLVDEYDVDTMAEKMLHLATDNYLAATLGQAARQRVKANFSLETQIQNLWQIIETAIRTHKSGV
ncbi:MAG: glycosyltransferase family 4 protein, partial [Okeania sp. SIO3B3]|nr:glycosyltransferase family 4 protein [Okeania sp. SIO3B3]